MFIKPVLSGTASLFYFLQLRRNQWKSPQELEEIQWKRLKNIVHYAYDYIPFYRRLFKSASFKPEDLRSLGDLEKIPTTTKKDVRRNFLKMFVKGIDVSKYDVSSTSGSTGVPMRILSNPKVLNYSNAVVSYCFLECGLGLRDNFVKVGRFNVAHYPPNISSIPIPAESSKLDIVVRYLRKSKPDAIYTLPWVLSSLCTADVSGIDPKLIFTHASTLTQHVRDVVKAMFGIEINDTYGAVEFNRMAFECNEHSGLHVVTDNSVMEFLDEGEPVSPGETGETVVTGLSNYAVPLIRYELGDLGVPTDESCSCGRNWPMIKSVEGRTVEIFTLESGRKIYPDFLHNCLTYELGKNIFCVSEFQIVQETRDKIVLNFIKGEKFDLNIINSIKCKIDNFFLDIGEDVFVEVKLVKEIPIESSGKKKIIKSLSEIT